MKYGVIDVGSNSVRLMLAENGKTLYKSAVITALSAGMGEDAVLQNEAVLRSAQAVSFFAKKASEYGAKKTLVYATQAVRRATNKQVFIDLVKELCGLEVDVVSGEKEAFLGAVGALGGQDGGVIDVGGASTEIIVVKEGNVLYSHSLDVGAVTLYDRVGEDKQKAIEYLSKKLTEYGDISKFSKANFYSIGGTATTICAMVYAVCPYDPTIIHNSKISKQTLIDWRDKLFCMTADERENIKGIQKGRGRIIACGEAILCAIMENLGIESFTVSESDNLEGYLCLYRENNEQKK